MFYCCKGSSYHTDDAFATVICSVLSWPGWDPISRLIFGVFLIHQMVIFYILGILQSSLKYTDTLFLMLLLSTIVMCYGLSAVVALFVELPIANVVSLCFKLAGVEARHTKN